MIAFAATLVNRSAAFLCRASREKNLAYPRGSMRAAEQCRRGTRVLQECNLDNYIENKL
ncbi:hypothetical protein D3C72_2494940 [compost metagenome]